MPWSCEPSGVELRLELDRSTRSADPIPSGSLRRDAGTVATMRPFDGPSASVERTNGFGPSGCQAPHEISRHPVARLEPGQRRAVRSADAVEDLASTMSISASSFVVVFQLRMVSCRVGRQRHQPWQVALAARGISRRSR